MSGTDFDPSAVPFGQSSPERALTRVLRELGSAADVCVIMQLTEEQRHFSVTHVHSSDAQIERELSQRLELGTVRALDTDEALSFAVTSRAPCIRTRNDQGVEAKSSAALLGGASISSVLVVPLQEGERVVGALTLLRCSPIASGFDERDVSRAQSLADYATLALTSTQLLQTSQRELAEREQMSARLELLAGLSKDFAEAMSGHVDDDVVRRSLLEKQHMFLQKPFSPQSLASQVREVLDGSPQSGRSHSGVLLKSGVARASDGSR